MHRRRGPDIGLALLAFQVFQTGLNNIPPVTLAVLAGCTALHYNFLDWNLPDTHQISLYGPAIVYNHEWHRLISSALFHAHDMHLYYNMASWLWKGRTLERRMGTPQFASIVAIFTVATSVVMSVLSYVLLEYFHYEHSFYSHHIGFSGVLFALKVLLTADTQEGTHSSVMGIPFPAKSIYWAELVLISIMVPNASFLGHVSGILVGLAYLRFLKWSANRLMRDPRRNEWQREPHTQPQPRQYVDTAQTTHQGGGGGGAPNMTDDELYARSLQAAETRQARYSPATAARQPPPYQAPPPYNPSAAPAPVVRPGRTLGGREAENTQINEDELLARRLQAAETRQVNYRR